MAQKPQPQAHTQHATQPAPHALVLHLLGVFTVVYHRYIPVIGVAFVKAATKAVPVHAVGPQHNATVVTLVPRVGAVSPVVKQVLLRPRHTV